MMRVPSGETAGAESARAENRDYRHVAVTPVRYPPVVWMMPLGRPVEPEIVIAHFRDRILLNHAGGPDRDEIRPMVEIYLSAAC